jgi:hypothetical protein
MTTANLLDPMTSDIRHEMDLFHSSRKPAAARRVINAPAWMFEDSPKVKAVKVAGLLAARQDVCDLMVSEGVTADRIAALEKYTGQLVNLGWTPSL